MKKIALLLVLALLLGSTVGCVGKKKTDPVPPPDGSSSLTEPSEDGADSSVNPTVPSDPPSPSPEKRERVELIFMAEGRVFAALSLWAAESFSMPDDPEKKGHLFKEWCYDEQGSLPYDPQKPLLPDGEGRVFLYARFEESEEIKGALFEALGKEGWILKSVEKGVSHFDVPATYKGLPVLEVGSNAFYKHEALCSVSLPDSLRSVGDKAFYGCSSLTDLTFGKGLTSIGASAFRGCISLEVLTLPEGLENVGSEAFYGCTALTSLRIPTGVKTLGNRIFDGCTSLKSLNLSGGGVLDADTFKGFSPDNLMIGKGVSSIGDQTFMGKKIRLVVFEEGVTVIGSEAFEGCSIESVSLPATLKELGSGAFENCSALKRAVFSGKELKILPERCFAGCLKLSEVVLPLGVEEICEDAFYQCVPEQVTLPDSVKLIKTGAFRYCELKRIDLGKGLQRVDSYAFAACPDLEELVFPESLEGLAYGAVSGCPSLKKIVFKGDEVETDNESFLNCGGVTEIVLPKKQKILNMTGFPLLSKVTLPRDLTVLEGSIFHGNTVITELTLPASVERIGDSVFMNCAIERIVLPEGLKEIGRSAFAGCEKLKQIDLPEGLEVLGDSPFIGCKSLKSVTVPKGVTSLVGTFSRCSLLETVILHDGITHISGAFSFCTSLKEMTLPASLREVGSRTFEGCTALERVTLPDGVTAIMKDAFSGCSSLKEINVPSGLLSVGDGAFADCTALSAFDLPESVGIIGKGAFTNSGLVKLNLPGKVRSLYASFSDCRNLKEVTLNKGLEYMEWAFTGCSSLEKVTLPDGLLGAEGAFENCTSLKQVIFSGSAYYLGRTFYGCSALEEIVLPQSVTSLYGTFSGCASLKKVVLPEGLEKLENAAFYGCTALEGIVLPRSLTQIDSKAFAKSGIRSLTVPAGVQTIGWGAFENCAALESLVLQGVPKNVGEGVLTGTPIYEAYLQSGERDLILSGVLFKAKAEEDDYTVPEGVVCIAARAVSGNVIGVLVPEGVKYIGSEAFSDCPRLEIILLSEGLEELGERAFAYLPLLEVTVPSTVKVIPGMAFYECSRLYLVELKGATRIEYSAFAWCGALKEVILPEGLLHIGANAFNNCAALEKIDLPESLESMEQGAFAGTPFTDDARAEEGLLYLDGWLIANTFTPQSKAEGTVKAGTVGIATYALEGYRAVTVAASVRFLSLRSFGLYDTLKRENCIFEDPENWTVGIGAPAYAEITETVCNLNDPEIPWSTIYHYAAKKNA